VYTYYVSRSDFNNCGFGVLSKEETEKWSFQKDSHINELKSQIQAAIKKK